MKISVIIPTYNILNRKYQDELCINKLINSLNNQTLNKDEFEVIFVDDKSHDKGIEYIKNNIGDINYNIIVNNENSGGASVPRNIGISVAQGEYLFFLDSDDYIVDNALEKMYSYANNNNSDILIPKFTGLGRGYAKDIFSRGSIDKADVISHNIISTMSVFRLYKREFILSNNITFPEDMDQYEDFYFTIKALTKRPVISILADDIYYFWVNTDGEGLSNKKIDFEKLLSYHERILKLMDNEEFCMLKARYIHRLLNLWMIKMIYKSKGQNFNEEILLNFRHDMVKRILNKIDKRTIECLSYDEKNIVKCIMNHDRYQVIELLKELEFKRNINKFYAYNTNAVDREPNYKVGTLFGFINIPKLTIDIKAGYISILGEVYSKVGRRFDLFRLKFINRSSNEVFSIENKIFNFKINIDEIYKYNEGYWDIYLEVEYCGLTAGVILPYSKASNSEETYEIYKNWLNGSTLRPSKS